MKNEILKNRNLIEGNFIGSILKDLPSVDDFMDLDITKELMLGESQFFFMLAKTIRKLGGNVFDQPSVLAFIEDKEKIKEKYNEYGGYEAISDLIDVVNLENSEQYYNELLKSNILLELNERGFSIKNDYYKLKNMSLEELHSWYEYHLNNIFVKVEHKVKIENMGVTDEDLIDFNSGSDMGISIKKNLPRLNYMLCGLPRKEMTYISGFQNTGKSTWTFVDYILPVVESGLRVMLVSNEQGIKNFKRLLMIHVLTRRLNYWHIPLKKLKTKNNNEKDLEMQKKAQKIINNEYMPNLLFAEAFDYNINTTKRLIKTANARGCELFVYDTFKLDSDGDGQAYIGFINDSKSIFQEIKKTNMAGIMTLQLKMGQKQRRVLDLDMFANALGVSEVASESLMIRALQQDEYTGMKNECKVWNYMKDENGKNTNIKEYVELKPDKRYVLVFHTKSRNSATGVQVLLEYNGDFCHYTELGYASCVDAKY